MLYVHSEVLLENQEEDGGLGCFGGRDWLVGCSVVY